MTCRRTDYVERWLTRQNEALHQSIREGAPVALKQLEEIEREAAFNKATRNANDTVTEQG